MHSRIGNEAGAFWDSINCAGVKPSVRHHYLHYSAKAFILFQKGGLTFGWFHGTLQL